METLEVVTQQPEALMLQALLKSHGIDCNIVGARNYASIIVGGTEGRYVVLVPGDKIDQARQILREVRIKTATEVVDTNTNPFRRAVFFAFAAALILPIVFNYASLAHAWKFWQSSDKGMVAKLKFLAICVLQIPPVFYAYYIISSYL